MKRYRVFVVGLILAIIPTLAAHAAELFSPGLPAFGTQLFTCRIVNVTNSSQTVTSQAFNSTGAPSSGPVTQTLGPGEAGGFAISAIEASMYCKFTVRGSKDGFRASVEVFDPTSTPPTIKVALSAY